MGTNGIHIHECESCAEAGVHGVPAIGHSTNPDWSGYWLCAECIAEYNRRSYDNLSGDDSEAAQ